MVDVEGWRRTVVGVEIVIKFGSVCRDDGCELCNSSATHNFLSFPKKQGSE